MYHGKQIHHSKEHVDSLMRIHQKSVYKFTNSIEMKKKKKV